MKTISKIVAIAALVLMVLSIIPMSAMAADESVTYTFSDYSDSAASKEQGYTKKLDNTLSLSLYGENTAGVGYFASELRIYKTNHAILTSTKGISAFSVNIGNKDGNLKVYTSTDGSTWTLKETVSYTSSYSDKAVTFGSPVKYIKWEFPDNQARLKTLTVTYTEASGGETPDVPACEHTNTETIPGKAATCTEDGLTAGTKCADCGEPIQAQETIKATGHNYVDGECEDCGAEKPSGIIFEFGDNGDATHVDGNDYGVSKEFTEGDYTLSLTNMSKVFGPAYDAQGNSCIKLGTSKVIGTFSFTVPDEVNEVVIAAAKYKTTNTTISVNGTSYTLTKNSDDGQYDLITVDTTTTKTVTVATVASTYRVMINSITYAVSEAGGETPDVPECDKDHNTMVCEEECACGFVKEHKFSNNCVAKCENGCDTANPNYVGHQYSDAYDANCNNCGAVLPYEDATYLPLADALEMGKALGSGKSSTDTYYVYGIIQQVYNTTYGNLYLVDDEGENKFTIYGTYVGSTRYDALTEKPDANDIVVIYGALNNYNGTAQIKNGQLAYHEKVVIEDCNHEYTSDYDATCNKCSEARDVSFPEVDKELTFAEIEVLGGGLDHNVYTPGKYYVIGTITEVYNEQYGNMYIEDEAGNKLTIYGSYSADGSIKYQNMDVKPAAGDKVKLYGIVGNYNDTVQMKNAWIIEIIAPACEHEYFYECDKVCALCGELTNEAATHNIIAVEAVDATCTENGNIAYWYCEYCGVAWTDEALTQQTNQKNVVVPAGHTYDNNCDYDCNSCGALRNPPHTLTAHVEAVVPANCKETGHPEYWICADCGGYFKNADGIGVLNPGWMYYNGAHVRPEGTAGCATVKCTLCGEDSYGTDLCVRPEGVPACADATCVNCGEAMYATPHTYATDDEGNYVTPLCQPGECVYCGQHFEYIYECYNDSYSECSVDGKCGYGCGKEYPATGEHDVDDPCAGGLCWICWKNIEPKHKYTYACDKVCAVCGELTNEAATHNIIAVEAVDATCYENGNIAYWYCEYCGQAWADEALTQLTNLKNVVVPMGHGNIIAVEAKDATCYEDGNIAYWYCEACGQAWLDAECTLNTNLKAVVLPMGHGNIIAVEAKDATCYEDGNIAYWYCEACGQAWLDAECTLNTNLKAVVLPMGHGNIIAVEAKDATCVENGNIAYWYCEACGQAWLDAECTLNTNLKAVVLPATGEHTYDDDADVDCNVCGAVREIVLTADQIIKHTGKSISADVDGLAFKFNAAINGIAFVKGYVADYANATVTIEGVEYKLITMGAVVNNKGENDHTLADVDNSRILNVVAKKVFIDSKGNTCFAIRIINIPENKLDATIVARPYFVYEKDGEQITVYGEDQIASYNSVING